MGKSNTNSTEVGSCPKCRRNIVRPASMPKRKWWRVVLDEAQLVSNYNTIRSEIARTINTSSTLVRVWDANEQHDRRLAWAVTALGQ